MSTAGRGGYPPRKGSADPGPPPGDEIPSPKPTPPPNRVIRYGLSTGQAIALVALFASLATLMISGMVTAWLASPDATEHTECTPLAPGVDCHIDGETGCHYYRSGGAITPRLSVIGLPLCGHYNSLDYLNPPPPKPPIKEDVAQYGRAIAITE